MADALLERIENVIDSSEENIVNIQLTDEENVHLSEVETQLKKGFGYECSTKIFEDWRLGKYKILTIHLDGNTGLTVPHANPIIERGGKVGGSRFIE